jgi:hypothetical protein
VRRASRRGRNIRRYLNKSFPTPIFPGASSAFRFGCAAVRIWTIGNDLKALPIKERERHFLSLFV